MMAAGRERAAGMGRRCRMLWALVLTAACATGAAQKHSSSHHSHHSHSSSKSSTRHSSQHSSLGRHSSSAAPAAPARVVVHRPGVSSSWSSTYGVSHMAQLQNASFEADLPPGIGPPYELVVPFVIVCGFGSDPVIDELQLLVKSILLMTRSFRVNITFATDQYGARVIPKLFKRLSPKRAHRSAPADFVAMRMLMRTLHVQIVRLDMRKLEELMQDTGVPAIHHSGMFGAAKTFLPWLLPDHDRYIVVDTDAVFVTDPTPLAVELWREGEWVYQMPAYPMEYQYKRPDHVNIQTSDVLGDALCSCLILMRADLVRERGVYDVLKQDIKWYIRNIDKLPTSPRRTAKVDEMVRSRRKHAPTVDGPPALKRLGAQVHLSTNPLELSWPGHRLSGDQPLFTVLFKRHPQLVWLMSPSWNYDLCHYYYAGMKMNPHWTPYMLHRNCVWEGRSILSKDDSASFAFDFFDGYRWVWLARNTDVTVSGDLEEDDGMLASAPAIGALDAAQDGASMYGASSAAPGADLADDGSEAMAARPLGTSPTTRPGVHGGALWIQQTPFGGRISSSSSRAYTGVERIRTDGDNGRFIYLGRSSTGERISDAERETRMARLASTRAAAQRRSRSYATGGDSRMDDDSRADERLGGDAADDDRPADDDLPMGAGFRDSVEAHDNLAAADQPMSRAAELV